MTKKVDLRKKHDERTRVDGGTLYRRGTIVQVWWTDSSHPDPRETWTAPDETQARREYLDMAERWNGSLKLDGDYFTDGARDMAAEESQEHYDARLLRQHPEHRDGKRHPNCPKC